MQVEAEILYARVYTREAPTPSPKIISIFGERYNLPKLASPLYTPLHPSGRIRRLNLTIPFTFRRLEGGLEGGASRGGFKGASRGLTFVKAFRKHEGGLKGT